MSEAEVEVVVSGGVMGGVLSSVREFVASHLVFQGIQSVPSQVAAQEPQPYPPDKPQHHLAAML